MLRKLIEHQLRQSGLTDDDVYFCSFSSKTLVYKGQLKPEQVCGGGGGRASRCVMHVVCLCVGVCVCV